MGTAARERRAIYAAFFFGAGRAVFACSRLGSSSPALAAETRGIRTSMTSGSFSIVPAQTPALPLSNCSGFHPIRTKKTTCLLSSVRHQGRTGSFRSVSTLSPSCLFHLWMTRTSNRAWRHFSFNPTRTMSRHVPAQSACAVNRLAGGLDVDAREPLNMTARAELPERPERRGMGLGETLHRQRKTCEAGVGARSA